MLPLRGKVVQISGLMKTGRNQQRLDSLHIARIFFSKLIVCKRSVLISLSFSPPVSDLCLL